MTLINFYLRDATSKNETLIYLIFNYDNQRIKVSTGFSILPLYWNKKTHRIRESIEFPHHADINEKLEDQSRIILKLYHNYRSQGTIPESDSLKKEFKEAQENPNRVVVAKSFWDHFENFIEYKKRELGDVRDYTNSLRKHLLATQKKFGKELSYAAIKNLNSGFIECFEKYLTYEALNSNGEKGLSTNTIGKQFKNLKVFLNWSFDRDIVARFSIKHLVTRTEEVDNIYLTDKEIEKLAALSLVSEQEKIVRDLFLIGCETALRFSDFTRLAKEHIRDDEIHFRPKKTEGSANNKVVIPISSRLDKVLKKYEYSPPSFESGNVTEFNKIIRRIAEKAKIDSDVVITKKIAGKTSEITYKKFELVSSHTCRRTFCTLKYLDEMPAQIIMKFSGHKTERAFMRYLKIDSELAAKQYRRFFK